MAVSKYNPEGYFDPTPHEALTNIEVEHRAARLAKVARSPNYRPIAPRPALLPVRCVPGVHSHRAAPLFHAVSG